MRVELAIVDACEGCGKCCMHIGLPPFEVPNPDFGVIPKGPSAWWMPKAFDQQVFDTELFMAMPPDLRAEHAAMVEALAPGESPSMKPCAWLDPETRRCRNYEWRPAVCRDWVPGDSGCNAARLRDAPVVWRSENDGDEDWWNPMLPLRDEPVDDNPEWRLLKEYPAHDLMTRLWWKVTDWFRRPVRYLDGPNKAEVEPCQT